MIDFDLGNALLPTMYWEEFQATDTYRLLTVHPEDCALLCNLFSADSLREMEFASNPRRGFHTMYGQEDFSETTVNPSDCRKRYQTASADVFLYSILTLADLLFAALHQGK